MRRHVPSLLAGLLAAVSAALLLLSGLIWMAGASSGGMLTLMRRYAPSEVTGLADEAYEPVCEMITVYLTGGLSDFQYELTNPDGTTVSCFNQREQAHMADCRALFRLDRGVCLVCAGLLLCSMALWRFCRRKSFRQGLAWGVGVVLLPVLALLVWGCLDFNSLFITFHRVAFTNDLWLMDWQTDLIIRLMPVEFFITYAAIIGGIWLLGLVLAEFLALRGLKKSVNA